MRLQRLGYRLLLWIAAEVDAGRLSFSFAHDVTTAPATAVIDILDRLWLPAELVPGAADREALANLFSTYLFTSFELIESPDPRFVSDSDCRCPVCVYLTAGSSLAPIKLGSADKRRARELERRYLHVLAAELGAPLSGERASEILTDAELPEPLALHAYARELLLRLEGVITGPEALALWRRFAWSPQGAPRPDFELTAELIMSARDRLAGAIRSSRVGAR